MSEHFGIYQGSVVNNNDPEARGRVQLQIPQVLGDTPSVWCEPIYPTVYKPKIYDVCWVHFVNGDIAKPVYYSSDILTSEKAIIGSLDANLIKTNTILTANLGITGSLTAQDGDPSAPRRVVVGGKGIYYFESGDNTTYDQVGTMVNEPPHLVEWPTDPTKPLRYRGDAYLKKVSVRESFMLTSDDDGTPATGLLDTGTSLVLGKGISAPQAPDKAIDWEFVNYAGFSVPATGLFSLGQWFDAGKFYKILASERVAAAGSYTRTTSVLRFPEAGGLTDLSYTYSGSGVNLLPTLIDVAVDSVNGFYYALCVTEKTNGTNSWSIYKLNGVGFYTGLLGGNATQFVSGLSKYISGGDSFNPVRGIAVSGSNVYMSFIDNGTDNLRLNRYDLNLENGVALTVSGTPGTFTTSNAQSTALSYGLEVGNFDFGALRIVVFNGEFDQFRPFSVSGSTITETAGGVERWSTASSLSGFTQSFSYQPSLSRFVGNSSFITAGFLTNYVYTANYWTTATNATWWVGNTYADTIPTTYQTNLSKKTKFTMTKRARLTLTNAAADLTGGTDKPDSLRFFIGRGTSEPSNSAMWLTPTNPAVGVNTLAVTAMTNNSFTGTNPPTTNNFPVAVAGRVTSSEVGIAAGTIGSIGGVNNPATDIRGDGKYRFMYGPDYNLEDTGWTNITLDTGYVASVSNPQYRRIGNEVRLRGYVAKTGGFTAGASNIFAVAGALPTRFRPPFRMDFQASANAAVLSVRLVVDTDGSLNAVTPAGTQPAYVSLNGVSYLVD